MINIWVVYKGFREALIDKINTFICFSLYGATKEINNEKSDESKRKTIRNSQYNNRKKNRNSRKRYSYERCQMLFHECPKRLANVVVNNDRAYLEPAWQPPEAA